MCETWGDPVCQGAEWEPAGVEVGQRHRTQLDWEAGVPYRLTGLVATEPPGAAEASGFLSVVVPFLDVGED